MKWFVTDGVGKRAYGLPDVKPSAPPMDTRNGGVTNNYGDTLEEALANEQTSYVIDGQRADGLPDGKQSAPPTDIHNNGGVNIAAPTFWRLAFRGFGEWKGFE
ncbi:unnamed protein product [Spodoptera exigua]|nr:unnamed protein product [Spodoptera exigua]